MAAELDIRIRNCGNRNVSLHEAGPQLRCESAEQVIGMGQIDPIPNAWLEDIDLSNCVARCPHTNCSYYRVDKP